MALIAAHLNVGHSGGDSVAIGIIYSPSSHTSIPPFTPFSPSLISLMVSVDVKHHVYLLIEWAACSTGVVRHMCNRASLAADLAPHDCLLHCVRLSGTTRLYRLD